MLARLSALLLCAALLLGTASAQAAPPVDLPATLARGNVTKRPIAVMIDNHPGAYPQIGLGQASVVFEALAEFGITRFMAIYVPGVTSDTPTIGPVRSARLYFVQWAMGFKALYAHAGGSPQALALLDQTGDVVNLDALKRNGGAYFTRSSKRSAPHNLFTSSANLDRAAATFKAAEISDADIGYLFKGDTPAGPAANATQIGYYFLYKQESVGWTYDAASNAYLRLRRGKSAIDGANSQQLSARNVVVIEVKERKIAGDTKGRIEQDVVGSGVGRLFVDGTQLEITWEKDNASAPLRFYLTDGSEAHFNSGAIWVAAIPNIANLTVK